MSKICPKCHEEFDDNHGFCSNCGSRLVDNIDLNPVMNLGDANAISGGVNINQSKNITSHDTHYHSTTIQERTKSEAELKLEAINQLRAKAEEIMNERGRIDSAAVTKLRQLALQLGIGNEDFKGIVTEVRSCRAGRISGLSTANARYLQQAQQAVQTNDMDTLSILMPRLEALAAISQDDNVQYLYYLLLAIHHPSECIELYERQTDENYWRTFWTVVSYIKEGRHLDATRMLAMLDPLRYEKSEEDQNLLEAYFNLIKGDKDETQGFLDTILGDTTTQVKPILRAIESTLYGEKAENSEVCFYMEWLIAKNNGDIQADSSDEKKDVLEPNDMSISEVPTHQVSSSLAEKAPTTPTVQQNDEGVNNTQPETKPKTKTSSKPKSEPEGSVVFHRIWVKQSDKCAVDIYMNLDLNGYEHKKVFLVFTTQLIQKGKPDVTLGSEKVELEPEYEKCSWEDLGYQIRANTLEWPLDEFGYSEASIVGTLGRMVFDNGLPYKLRTTVKVRNSKGKALPGSAKVEYRVKHIPHILREDEIPLIND